MIARQGTLVSIYRPTYSTNADGTRVVSAWTLVLANAALNLQGIGYDTTQRVFGTQEVIEADGYILPSIDLQREDRVLVTAGPFAALMFRVVELKSHRQASGSDHLEVALQSTTEIFP